VRAHTALRAALAPVLVALLAACTGNITKPSVPVGPASPVPTVSLPSPGAGRESAEAVRARLCRRPPLPTPTPAKAASVPQAVRDVEDQVQTVRGLRYEHPVAVDAVTHRELVEGIDESFDHSFPRDLMARRQRAWETIGVIPYGTNLQGAYRAFLSSQVIGYYDPSTGQLVFIGTDDPTPVERLTLAHELTHADDDQHFDLGRINGLENRCLDEEELAATGAVEGSAVFFSYRVAQRFFSQADISSLLNQEVPGPEGVPVFLERLLAWPYVDGPKFIAALEARGGLGEVNAALRDWPVSTEQILHPVLYPTDRPEVVDVPPLAPRLEHAPDVDVMDVGEEWLREMLKLRLPADVASEAASGWDGGQYRAWSVRGGVLVAMLTAWDTPRDASQFAGVLTHWIRPGEAERAAMAGKDRVLALFATNGRVLGAAGSRPLR
jgi:hypothetical protein